MESDSKDRLIGWKAIGKFVGRDERTVRRWEAERGLPIHRVPGGGSATVWADPDELTAWMDADHDSHTGLANDETRPGNPDQTNDSTNSAKTSKSTQSWRFALIGAPILCGLAVVGAAPWWKKPESKVPTTQPYGANQSANIAYSNARFAMEQRTVPGLMKAAHQFAVLTEQQPGKAAAFIGLAETNLLLREFNALPDEIAYRRATLASQRALAIEPNNPHALRSLGFIRFWSEGDMKSGLDLLKRATDTDPKDAHSQHWYGTALFGAGKFDEALAALRAARAINPGSSAIAADEAFVRYMNGERDSAKAALKQIAAIDPMFSGPQAYLERIALAEGDAASFLHEALITAEMKHDANKLALMARAKAAFERGGKAAMLALLIKDAERRFQQDEGTALWLARLHATAGNRAGVLAWLTRAESLRQPDVRQLVAHPDFVSYRNDPEFSRFFPKL